ncbi:antirestriction protein ArdA [Eubacteriaceae bacterium ES3]|nr:antirestriction protein ArdA [Eubacteriaceae bacterium ES3]
MYFTIRKEKDTHENQVEAWLPLDDLQLINICDDLGIGLKLTEKIHIVDSSDADLSMLIKEKFCNIDELNFLAKRLDSFDAKEKLTFFASAAATEAGNVKDLINLTYNTHCYSVISDFKNLDSIGRDLYLNETGGATMDELNAVDGRVIVEDLMNHSPMQVVTPYGVVYQNRNEPEMFYDGNHFPRYHWKPDVATITLEHDGNHEFIYMPCPDTTIARVVSRLDTESLSDCVMTIDSDYLPEQLIQWIAAKESPEEKVILLNEFSNKFKEMGARESNYFEKLMDYVPTKSLEEVEVLLDHLYEFQLFDDIRSPEAYGHFMICESGHFEYDENLEEYIDFKRYGEQRIQNESGAFTNRGYIVYRGFDPVVQNLLSEKLGMKADTRHSVTELKLYMPLRAITYDVENDYGYMEQSDYEEEIPAHELLTYEDDIVEALEKFKMPNEAKRGLMAYYDECDSVNAKVAKYEFSVEEVEGELMGVAILTLNAPLNEMEMNQIKEVITGQASDGAGESFEQREIKTADRSIYVCFWNPTDWSIMIAEELGITNHAQTMGRMKL